MGRKFLSTPSARRATDVKCAIIMVSRISIHALREEGDFLTVWPRWASTTHFYPRPPRGGRPVACAVAFCQIHFYPRPPRGGRPECRRRQCPHRHFYPRPPRGGRPLTINIPAGAYQFLSTPSARRATSALGSRVVWLAYFYPRPPRGGRPFLTACPRSNVLFLSTPSARRATSSASSGTSGMQISIHALREEGDAVPAPPPDASQVISIHALREEGDPEIVFPTASII